MGARRARTMLLVAVTLGLSSAGGSAQAPAPELRIVTDEADAALEVLRLRRSAQPVGDAVWTRLFASEGYRRLKAREAAMGRGFSDPEFRAFLLSDTLLRRAPDLERTLAAWKTVPAEGAAARALAYLPPGSRLRARVYLLVKPRTNSFVFEADTDPAIMLYLDPALPPAALENTIAHELHHIGYAGACAEAGDSASDPAVSTVRRWLGAFGEGVAMLAAAGGPDVHPQATGKLEDRARWDRDVARVEEDMRRLERFFLDILEQRLTDPDSTRQVGMSFFGVQGPWYTVGWVMGTTVERVAGREALIGALCDPPTLLRRYNQSARAAGLPQWSDALLARLGPSPAR